MRSLEYPIQFRARGDGLGVPHSGQCSPHGYIMEPHLEQKIRWEYSRRRQKTDGLYTFALANREKTCYTTQVCWREIPWPLRLERKNSLEVLINA